MLLGYRVKDSDIDRLQAQGEKRECQISEIRQFHMLNGNLIYTWSSGMLSSPGNFFAGSSGEENIFFSRKQTYLSRIVSCMASC